MANEIITLRYSLNSSLGQKQRLSFSSYDVLRWLCGWLDLMLNVVIGVYSVDLGIITITLQMSVL